MHSIKLFLLHNPQVLMPSNYFKYSKFQINPEPQRKEHSSLEKEGCEFGPSTGVRTLVRRDAEVHRERLTRGA
jgi:hypothetical protein